MSRSKLVVLGGGRMGEALVGGLLEAGWATAPELSVVELAPERRTALGELFPGLRVEAEAVAGDGVVVAVKPPDVEAACTTARAAGVERALSIAAGVRLSSLERWLGDSVPVVRAMPNTPAFVGAAASAIAGGTHAGVDDLDWAEEILRAVGTVVRVPEELLDAVTGLSGSGPAYVFLLAEALTEGGIAAGLPPETAAALTRQTLLGAARLLVETGDTPEALRIAVTSKGGTTAAALALLEERGVRAAFADAVAAATARSKEMGEQ